MLKSTISMSKQMFNQIMFDLFGEPVYDSEGERDLDFNTIIHGINEFILDREAGTEYIKKNFSLSQIRSMESNEIHYEVHVLKLVHTLVQRLIPLLEGTEEKRLLESYARLIGCMRIAAKMNHNDYVMGLVAN